MPGDGIVDQPWDVTTRATTIAAAPEQIWRCWPRWATSGAACTYSHDWIDRFLGVLDGPSAGKVLPEFQNLQPCDEIPTGNSPGWRVDSVESKRSLVLDLRHPGIHISWSFLLEPFNEGHTRPILRIRIRMRPLVHVVSTFPIFGFANSL